MRFQRSLDVPHFNNYRNYREYLRRDFRFRRAYCLTHEFYFQGDDGGEIDHFRPLNPPEETGKYFAHLRNDYSNLYWVCRVCNNRKGNKWPTDERYERGERFLDPCEEDHDSHWRTWPDGTVTSLTTIGQYTVRQLSLNRPALVQYRRWLYGLEQTAARIREALETTVFTEAHRRALQNHLRDLEQMIEPPVVSSLTQNQTRPE
jgi:hypothetical protein